VKRCARRSSTATATARSSRFARSIDFNATRRLAATVPAVLAPPIAIRNFYAVGNARHPPLTVAGALSIHDCTATFPGAQAP